MSAPGISLETIRQYMEVAGVPGLAYCLIEGGRVAATYAIGVKDSETGEPLTEHTVFQVASLSKPVFAYGVLSLLGEGKLDLDRPLHEYLPLPEADEVPQLKQVTARHALTHTSGLQNWRFDPAEHFEFAFEPGAGFSYSGEGFFYLQRVIEQICGQSLESFLQERVLRPLGMEHSTYIWRAEHEALASMGHHHRGKKAEPWNMRQGRRLLEIAAQLDWPLDQWLYADFVQALPQVHPELAPLPNNMIPNAAASLLTSVGEYARFLLRLLYPMDPIARQMLEPHYRLNSVLSWGLGIGRGIVILTNDVRGLYICERILRQVNRHDLSAFLWI